MDPNQQVTIDLAVAKAVAASLAAQAAVPGQAPNVPPAPIFALAPALVEADVFINYKT